MSYHLHSQTYSSCYLQALFTAYGYLRSPSEDRALTSTEVSQLLSQSNNDKDFQRIVTYYQKSNLSPTPLQLLTRQLRNQYHELSFSEKSEYLKTYELIVQIVELLPSATNLRIAQQLYTKQQEFIIHSNSFFHDFPLITYYRVGCCMLPKLYSSNATLANYLALSDITKEDLQILRWTVYYYGLHILYYELHAWAPI